MPQPNPDDFASQTRLKPLVIEAGQVKQLQDDYLLVDFDNNAFLVELFDSLTLYVDPLGDDENNDGSIGEPFATMYRAVSEFSRYAPVGSATVTVNVAEGFYPLDIPITWSWPYSASLTINGAKTTFTGATLSNYTGTTTEGSLRYFDVDLTLTSGTATIGQYVLINSATGGTNPQAVYGLHEIIDVSGSVLTIRIYQRLGVSVLPSGAITVGGTIIQSIFNVADVIGLQFDGAGAGFWDGFVLRRDSFGGSTGIFLINNASWRGQNFGVARYATGVLSDRGSFFRSTTNFGLSQLSSIGAAAQDGGVLVFAGTGLFANGTVLQALNSARSAYLLMFGGQITACGSPVPVRADELGNIEISAGGIQYQSAAGQTALDALRYGRIISSATITGYDVTESTASGGSIFRTAPRVALETYNAKTSPTSFERLIGWWDTNVAKIQTEVGSGGGTLRDLALLRGTVEHERFTSTETVFNEGGVDLNFRVEGEGDVDCFVIDASALSNVGAVGIGTATPGQKLDVVGDARIGAASGAQGSRIIGRGEHTSAPAGTLATGEWELSVYDDGASPVFRIRYNDGGSEVTGDVALV